MKYLIVFSIPIFLTIALNANAEPVWPYTCKQLEEMEHTDENLCRLAEMGDVFELRKRLSANPNLANVQCNINARYYGKRTVNNTLFTLVLAARDFWDFEDFNISRRRNYPAVCHPEAFQYRVEELEATGLLLSELIDPNAAHEIGGDKPPYGRRTNIETLCESAMASGNQFIPHSRALDLMQRRLFERGAVFHGYCGQDKDPHP